jgi:hypothetical protein
MSSFIPNVAILPKAQLFPVSLKKKLRSAAMGASPVRAPRPSYLSIEASAASVGR